MPFTPNPNPNSQNKANQPAPESIDQDLDLAPEAGVESTVLDPDDEAEKTSVTPTPEVAPLAVTADSKPDASVQEDESTIGTGTSMALGCVAGTVVLIGFGLLFLFISTLI